MFNVISTKFSEIATYSMGVNQWNKDKSWDQADSTGLVAKAAAEFNRDRHSTMIRVAQGIYQNDDNNMVNKEIANAFDASQYANQVHANTVWSIVFTNEYFVDEGKGRTILDMIRNNKDRAHQMGLKVGTRIHTCGIILEKGNGLYNLLADIVRESDFIMCNLYPSEGVVHGPIQDAVNSVGGYYQSMVPAFHQVKGNLEVLIGETGWPSQGISFNKSPNTPSNLKEYWTRMNQWASQNQVKTYMFEAIDEPWKSNKNSHDQNASNGPNGGEGHYGWWKREDVNNKARYIEK
jgi:exo-beta-1,3-glucanase (GH17 family)